jgi:Zn-dependent protease with chaperone function
MSGAWLRGVVGAVGFNCVGVVLSLLYPGLTPTKFVALSTLWSFLGVLVLPSLSRPAVFASDRLALDAGVAPEALKETILALDRRQDNEPERPQHIETIFHPIPSAGTRIRAIESQKELSKIGGWQLLRTALYLSWASGSLLSRAVHCNIGRPELWVYFPGD